MKDDNNFNFFTKTGYQT